HSVKSILNTYDTVIDDEWFRRFWGKSSGVADTLLMLLSRVKVDTSLVPQAQARTLALHATSGDDTPETIEKSTLDSSHGYASRKKLPEMANPQPEIQRAAE